MYVENVSRASKQIYGTYRLGKVSMKPKSEKSIELYNILLRRGYPEPFCDEVSKNLNTDWTAQRLIGYLSHYQKLKMEDVADEVLAILSDRNRIMQKKRMEEANARWNQFLYESFENEEEESYHG